MSSKNYVDVIIDGKIYNIGGFESEAYLQKVATYINNMIQDFKQNESYRMQNMDMQRILLEINIANDLELKEKEVYDLKHELIVSDSKAETATKELDEALEKIKNLEKEIVKLQTELEK